MMLEIGLRGLDPEREEEPGGQRTAITGLRSS